MDSRKLMTPETQDELSVLRKEVQELKTAVEELRTQIYKLSRALRDLRSVTQRAR